MVGLELVEDELDAIPSGIEFSFDRTTFYKNEFQPNLIIEHTHQIGNSFEEFQKDLFQYLNILKISLIELINKEYQVFVDISFDLNTIGRIIDEISSPVIDYHSKIKEFLSEIEQLKNLIQGMVNEKISLENLEDEINTLKTISDCIDQLENWLNPLTLNEDNTQMMMSHCSVEEAQVIRRSNLEQLFPGVQDEVLGNLIPWPDECLYTNQLKIDPIERIDRVCDEFIKLNHYSKKFEPDHKVFGNWKSRIIWIENNIKELLCKRLKQGIDLCISNYPPQTSSIDLETIGATLRQVISTYAALDSVVEAEVIYGRQTMLEEMKQIINFEEVYRKAIDDCSYFKELDGIFEEVLRVLDKNIKMFNTYSTKGSNEGITIHSLSLSSMLHHEFDLIGGAFWWAFVQVLSNQGEFYSVSEPKRFTKTYNKTMEFINKVESRMEVGRVAKFRNSPLYQQFMSKWTLPVYSRFIVKKVSDEIENAVINLWLPYSHGKYGVRLKFFETLLDNIVYMWSDEVFISPLRHQCVKMTLQLFKRYLTAFPSEISTQDMKTSSAQPTEREVNCLIFKRSIDILHDSMLINTCVERLFNSVISPKFSTCLQDLQDSEEVENGFSSLFNKTLMEFEKKSVEYRGNVQENFSKEINLILNSMVEIPRLYRRMKRDLPKEPSSYIQLIIARIDEYFKVIQDFNQTKDLPSNTVALIINDFINALAKVYQSKSQELLAVVKKTGESMKMIREAKRNTSSNNLANFSKPDQDNDEDKIKHQLHLDADAIYNHVIKVLPEGLEGLNLAKLTEMKDVAI